MSSEPTPVTVTFPQRPMWADLLLMALSLAAMAGMILLLMPASEREILLTVVRQQRDRMSHGLSARARLAGLAGMSDELAGRSRARVWYQEAAALSWWRDRVKP